MKGIYLTPEGLGKINEKIDLIQSLTIEGSLGMRTALESLREIRLATFDLLGLIKSQCCIGSPDPQGPRAA